MRRLVSSIPIRGKENQEHSIETDAESLFGASGPDKTLPVAAGQAYSGAAAALDTVSLEIGGVPVTPSFAGLSGAGCSRSSSLYLAGLAMGDVPLALTSGGGACADCALRYDRGINCPRMGRRAPFPPKQNGSHDYASRVLTVPKSAQLSGLPADYLRGLIVRTGAPGGEGWRWLPHPQRAVNALVETLDSIFG